MDRHIANLTSILSTGTPSTLGEKKLRELWSTNKKVIRAHIAQPKQTFCGRLHFGLWGCYPLNFVHALQIDQVVLAHTTTATGVPLKN